jgi:hypothetical protein
MVVGIFTSSTFDPQNWSIVSLLDVRQGVK